MKVNNEGPNHKVQFEVSKITDQIYIGTNLCCTEKSHIQILHELGIDAEIDLEEERSEAVPKIGSYLWLPVKDETPPTQEQFLIGVKMVDTVVKMGKKIYIHCKFGHGRAPTLTAAYLIFKGVKVDEAVREILQKRPEAHPEKSQIEALREFEKRLKNAKNS